MADLDDPAVSPEREEAVNAPVRPLLEREDDVNAGAWLRHGHPQRERAAGEAE